jgi:hypothetical protein
MAWGHGASWLGRLGSGDVEGESEADNSPSPTAKGRNAEDRQRGGVPKEKR